MSQNFEKVSVCYLFSMCFSFIYFFSFNDELMLFSLSMFWILKKFAKEIMIDNLMMKLTALVLSV